MGNFKVAIPVTFALALSASQPAAGIASVGDPSELLKPGSLRNLVGPSAAAIRDEIGGPQVDQGVKQKVACYYGYWRRC